MKLKLYHSKHKTKIKNIQHKLYNGYYKYADIGGIKSFVIEKGEGIPVILLHGLLACTYTWRNVFYPLSEHFHVYAYDLKGCGCSGKPKYQYSIESFTKELREFMIFFNIKSAILVGNSLGGEIALNMAIEYPEMVEKLILIDASGCRMNMKKSSFLVKLGRISYMPWILKIFFLKKIISLISLFLVEDHTVVDKEFIDAYYSAFKCDEGVHGFVSLIKNLSYTEFCYEKVKNIQIPTLIIWGEKDKLIHIEDAYKISKDIKNAKLIIIPKCGHGPQEECGERVVEEIHKFILDK